MASKESKEPTKRDLQAAQTKQRLIEVGQRLLSEKGYDAVTIGDITKACGVSKGTFYVYFKSKEQLLGTLQYAPYLELDEKVSKDTSPVAHSIRVYITSWIDYFSQYSPHFAASWLGHTDNDNLDLLEDYKDQYGSESAVASARIDKIKMRLDRAVTTGELVDACPTRAISFSIATRCYGLCVWHSLSKGETDIRRGARIEAALIERLLRSYRGPAWVDDSDDDFDDVAE